MEAKSGSDMFDFPGQAAQSVSRQSSYVTVLMGHNDVCQNTFAEIPTDAVFEAKFREGMAKLKAGLPAGATVYVVGIVDIYRLGRSPPTRGHWASWTAKSSGPRACSSGTPVQPC